MAAPVLVTGGTGTLGRRVVDRLTAAGVPVRVLSRTPREATGGAEYVVGDLTTGAGVAEAVAGAPTIVHLASAQKGDAATTATLVRAAEQAGTAHLVFISIVGVDRVSFGYFKEKLAAEQVVCASTVPWTVLRATQFYDMIYSGARKLAKLPVVPVPRGFPVEPVDASDVADRLVELALAPPAGRVPDLTGPHRTTFAGTLRDLLRVTGKRRPVLQLWFPGMAKINAGGLLAPDSTEAGPPQRGKRSWEDFVRASTAPPVSEAAGR
ncbi:NAD(P)H-binding protein [Dactylosporangium aurantiacum]|uniref:NAD(P)H-binding protein n=1 Tax=Dactylosporangium aurantiacum TaxID=35754 RepID=A0A9Q9IAC1_9ACTN|nr:NAD(P)H-binding protein [Dactylosporangium aurantiacum]MDG6106603.1 NAD(P)H-binding protein [Dactylosporangium aurantiacum]UWZ50765.1 NAD(P)H-binding protein [Dactylosporangium aurantiacum]